MGHRASGLLGFRSGKIGNLHQNLKGLLLEQNYPIGARKRVFQNGVRIRNQFEPLSALDQRADHRTLNGARADRPGTDHNVIESLWEKSWKKGKLCPAFQLKDSDGVSFL